MAVLTAAALASGCGSSGNEAGGEGQPSTAAQAVGSGLTRHQYDELERLLVAMLPFDAVREASDPEQIQRKLEQVSPACSEVDRGDPLLAAMVDGCERTFAAFGTADADCSTAAECARAMASVADAMEDLVVTVHRNRPTITRAIPAGRCRDVMLSTEEVEAAELAVPVFRRAAEAVSSADPAALAAVEDDLKAVEARQSELPSVRDELRSFRRFCRPESA